MSVERVKVTGVKFYQGNIDGKAIDSGTIFIEESLDFTTGRAKGYAVSDYALGKADAARALMQHEFPFVADVEFMRVTNGDVSKNIVVNVKHIGEPRKAA